MTLPSSLATAIRTGAVALAADPALNHYSPETLIDVYSRTVHALAGARTLENAAARLAVDPVLTQLPDHVVEELVDASFRHFAYALGIGGPPHTKEQPDVRQR